MPFVTCKRIYHVTAYKITYHGEAESGYNQTPQEDHCISLKAFLLLSIQVKGVYYIDALNIKVFKSIINTNVIQRSRIITR